MKIAVPIKLVPDLVEELTIDASGAALDTAWLRMILNEFDGHAIEQALLLAERIRAEGGASQVTILAPDLEGVDDVLYSAAAKGADRLIKLSGDYDRGFNNHALARLFSPLIQEIQPDLVLTGVQAHNDLDGPVGPQLAALLDLPYVGYVASVHINGDQAGIHKEYPGGVLADMVVSLPAVLGIQAAESPPRYVAFSKIRQAMSTATIEGRRAEAMHLTGGPVVTRLYQPGLGERAKMLGGDVDHVANQLIAVLKDLDLV